MAKNRGSAGCTTRLRLTRTGIAVEPVYLGKPYPLIYEYALSLLCERYGLATPPDPHRIVMVGDSLTADSRGGKRSGLTTALVLTGITTAAQAESAVPELRPDLVFATLG